MDVQVNQILARLKGLWEEIPQEYMIILTLGGIVFALLNCFMGYRLRKVWGCILGILAGGAAGGVAGYYFTQDMLLSLFGGLGGALLLGLLAWVFYKLGVFVMCAGLVYFSITSLLGEPDLVQHGIALVAGVFAGTLALGYEQQLVIAITALCGGIGGMHLILSLTGIDSMGAKVVLGLALAALGAFIQALPLLKRRRRDEEEEEFSLPRGPRVSLPRRKKKKKAVKRKTKVQRVKEYAPVQEEKSSSKKSSAKKKPVPDLDAEDYDDEDLEEIYAARRKAQRKRDMEQARQHGYGQDVYSREQRTSSSPVSGAVDLDDLSRELSQEIQKIYEDENYQG